MFNKKQGGVMGVREILEFWQSVSGNGGFFLKDAMDFTDNAHRTLPANGAINFNHQGGLTKMTPYATFNSPIHCLTGFPAETIFKNGSHWEENGESNGFPLKSRSTLLPEVDGQFIVETEYDFPEGYNGPQYKKRRIWFDKLSQTPVRVEMEYQNGEKDVGKISFSNKQGEGTIMKIDWQCQYGPNQMNVNFF